VLRPETLYEIPDVCRVENTYGNWGSADDLVCSWAFLNLGLPGL
jgi:hypothetical protein